MKPPSDILSGGIGGGGGKRNEPFGRRDEGEGVRKAFGGENG